VYQNRDVTTARQSASSLICDSSRWDALSDDRAGLSVVKSHGLLQVKVTLRPTVSQPVQSVLVSGAHLGPATNFSFCLRFSFRQLRVCYFVALSPTRGLVCNLLFMLVPAKSSFARVCPLWREVGSVFCQYQSMFSIFIHVYIIHSLPLPRTHTGTAHDGISVMRRAKWSKVAVLRTLRAELHRNSRQVQLQYYQQYMDSFCSREALVFTYHHCWQACSYGGRLTSPSTDFSPSFACTRWWPYKQSFRSAQNTERWCKDDLTTSSKVRLRAIGMF
jgi:hypothetical protein